MRHPPRFMNQSPSTGAAWASAAAAASGPTSSAPCPGVSISCDGITMAPMSPLQAGGGTEKGGTTGVAAAP